MVYRQKGQRFAGGTHCKLDVLDGGSYSLCTTPRVTHVGAMAFTTVMGFDQEGPLSHSECQSVSLSVRV